MNTPSSDDGRMLVGAAALTIFSYATAAAEAWGAPSVKAPLAHTALFLGAGALTIALILWRWSKSKTLARVVYIVTGVLVLPVVILGLARIVLFCFTGNDIL